MTIGVEAPPWLPTSALAESEFCDGGQSTPVGGQLSPPEPDVSPGGAHPEPAPKSPAPEQSTWAEPASTTAIWPIKSDAEHSAAAALLENVLNGLTTRGCPRRR